MSLKFPCASKNSRPNSFINFADFALGTLSAALGEEFEGDDGLVETEARGFRRRADVLQRHPHVRHVSGRRVRRLRQRIRDMGGVLRAEPELAHRVHDRLGGLLQLDVPRRRERQRTLQRAMPAFASSI
jgi:hypothetical protein